MDSTSYVLGVISFSKQNYSINIEITLCLLFVVALIIGFFILIRYLIKKKNLFKRKLIPKELKFNFGSGEIKYDIISNDINIDIAHRIYVELITRKAAIKIDQIEDVIVEVYNSWYELFRVTRDEIKKMNSMFLRDDNAEEIIRLATDVLNKGLRPHLTKYQAKFRKWYNEELQKEKESKTYNTPQQIQQKCEYYNELISDIKRVNDILIEYKNKLHLIIYGKSKK